MKLHLFRTATLAVFILGGAHIASAQILSINGTVKSRWGSFVFLWPAPKNGDAITINFDFGRGTEIFDSWNESFYRVPRNYIFNGQPASSSPETAIVGISKQPGRYGFEAVHTEYDDTLALQLFSNEPIISSTHSFPSDIPFSTFSTHSGLYNEYPPSGPSRGGGFEIDITSYSVYTAIVPEPAAYGFLVGLVVLGFVIWRRRDLPLLQNQAEGGSCLNGAKAERCSRRLD